MSVSFTRVRTALCLGLPNIGRALLYRTSVRLGINPVRRLQASMPSGPFFNTTASVTQGSGSKEPPVPEVLQLFSHFHLPTTAEPPDWLANPMTGQSMPNPQRPWWQIPDFDPNVGDIKLIWELSRLDWVLPLAKRARGGDTLATEQMNAWLDDWSSSNPPFKGPNWKCGQEASIRVMNVAMAAIVLDQVGSPNSSLLDWVALHLKRITPTLSYAMAQDNNHGTSEAAALFIGGSWLVSQGRNEGAKWSAQGRKWLENRAARLIGTQGSFSQYSLNYHRVMLDTLCMAELWRRHLNLLPFSAQFLSRALAATQWLRHMVNPVNGDGPNVGANDGARLLQLVDADYRDHRPTVQLAMALFADACAYAGEGAWDDARHTLGVPQPTTVAPPVGSYVADDGGFAVLRCESVMAMLRYPRFKFRPSQADALHLDLWIDGENLLRDAGTYSYNTEPQWLNYFGGTAGHNTVQFDDRDQMPRLSRFLFGDWLETSILDPLREQDGRSSFGAGYIDRAGASHQRQITLDKSSLKIADRIDGFRTKGVLRWRLAPGAWQVDGDCVRNGAHVLRVKADMPLVRFELTTGWESRYYLEKTELPVLEIEVDRPGTLMSEYRWAP